MEARMNFETSLRNWKNLGELTVFEKHQEIKAYLRSLFFDHIHQANPDLASRQMFEALLVLDIADLSAQLAILLMNDVKYRELIGRRDKSAQTLLNILQARLDYRIEAPFKARHLKALFKLSASTGLYPECLVLEDMDLSSDPVAGGGFGDLYKTCVEGRDIAIKVLRVYQKSDMSKILKMVSGLIPFWDKQEHMVIISVSQGKRPGRPSDPSSRTRGLTDDIWDFIVTCWSQKPKERLTATQAVHHLRALPCLLPDHRDLDIHHVRPPLQTVSEQEQDTFLALQGFLGGETKARQPIDQSMTELASTSPAAPGNQNLGIYYRHRPLEILSTQKQQVVSAVEGVLDTETKAQQTTGPTSINPLSLSHKTRSKEEVTQPPTPTPPRNTAPTSSTLQYGNQRNWNISQSKHTITQLTTELSLLVSPVNADG
ncbi:hypothetical protein HWV62_21106 [Athelia sp. TMB]|nr:hypothetical protein HWV62_21106 [Athelia sp. TMB]